MEIKTGNALAVSPKEYGNIIVAHCCNNIGAWGAGFVKAIDEISHLPNQEYKKLAKTNQNFIPLGEVQFVEVSPNFSIANMIAQHGITKLPGDRRICYDAFNACLSKVFEKAATSSCSIHMPSGIGSGLAGGSKSEIHKIVQTLSDKYPNIKVVMWEYNDTSSPFYVESNK